MSDVDIRREKLVKQFKFGGLALALLLVVPFLFTLAMVAAGTVVAAGIAVVGGIVLVNFIPVIAMKAANRRLKAMKAEARENPIETAENQLVKMSQQLDAFQQDTASYLAKGKALIDDVTEMRKEDPEGAAAYNDDIKNFEIEAALRGQKIQAAVTELEEARTKIDRARRRWNMQLKHSSFLVGSKEAEATLDKILIDEALSTVMESAHKATASMMVENIAAKARSDYKANKSRGNTDGIQIVDEAVYQPALTDDRRDGFIAPSLIPAQKVMK